MYLFDKEKNRSDCEFLALLFVILLAWIIHGPMLR